MIDLSTRYLGLKLRTPLVVSASPLSHDLDNIRRLEEAGASAVVLYSLFEEQLRQERFELEHHLTAGTDSFAEAASFLPQPSEFHVGPEGYLKLIHQAKKAVSIPIIASLNGTTVGGWTQYAQLIQQAGADALECNIYFLATDPDVESADIERQYLEIVEAVKSVVSIPVAVKVSPFFSNMANMAKRFGRRAGFVQSLLSARYQPRRTGNRTQRFIEHGSRATSAAHLGRNPLRPGPREPGCDHRRAGTGRRNQAADGRRRCHHALLYAVAQRHPSPAPHRKRIREMDGRSRIRIGGADEGQHEPVTLPESRSFRARPVHESREERAARRALQPRSLECS